MKELFASINANYVGSGTNAVRRRTQSLRINPFITFREPDPDENLDEGSQHAEPQLQELEVIAKYYDGHARNALMVFETGHFERADGYAAGLGGFVIASWSCRPGEKLELEVPNSCLVMDGDGNAAITTYKPPMTSIAPEKAAMKPKKPAKTKSAKGGKKPNDSVVESDSDAQSKEAEEKPTATTTDAKKRKAEIKVAKAKKTPKCDDKDSKEKSFEVLFKDKRIVLLLLSNLEICTRTTCCTGLTCLACLTGLTCLKSRCPP